MWASGSKSIHYNVYYKHSFIYIFVDNISTAKSHNDHKTHKMDIISDKTILYCHLECGTKHNISLK